MEDVEGISDEVLFPPFNLKRKKQKPVVKPARWIDPLSPIERWFSYLPCKWIEDECHCGSRKPVLYWHREEGTGCEDCHDPTIMVSIVESTIWNFIYKFDLSKEAKDEIWRKYKEM